MVLPRFIVMDIAGPRWDESGSCDKFTAGCEMFVEFSAMWPPSVAAALARTKCFVDFGLLDFGIEVQPENQESATGDLLLLVGDVGGLRFFEV